MKRSTSSIMPVKSGQLLCLFISFCLLCFIPFASAVGESSGFSTTINGWEYILPDVGMEFSPLYSNEDSFILAGSYNGSTCFFGVAVDEKWEKMYQPTSDDVLAAFDQNRLDLIGQIPMKSIYIEDYELIGNDLAFFQTYINGHRVVTFQQGMLGEDIQFSTTDMALDLLSQLVGSANEQCAASFDWSQLPEEYVPEGPVSIQSIPLSTKDGLFFCADVDIDLKKTATAAELNDWLQQLSNAMGLCLQYRPQQGYFALMTEMGVPGTLTALVKPVCGQMSIVLDFQLLNWDKEKAFTQEGNMEVFGSLVGSIAQSGSVEGYYYLDTDQYGELYLGNSTTPDGETVSPGVNDLIEIWQMLLEQMEGSVFAIAEFGNIRFTLEYSLYQDMDTYTCWQRIFPHL